MRSVLVVQFVKQNLTVKYYSAKDGYCKVIRSMRPNPNQAKQYGTQAGDVSHSADPRRIAEIAALKPWRYPAT